VPKPTSKITAPVARTRKGRSARGNTVSVPYEDTLIESLRDPEEAAACLEAALEDGDQAVLMLALRQVAQARGGVAPVARKATLTREATYRMLSERGNPAPSSLTAVLAATGLQLSVKPIAHPKVRREKPRRAT
jgi:probable addiction module antidote protein